MGADAKDRLIRELKDSGTKVGKGEGHITGTVRKKLMDYLEENGISVYRFVKDSGIPQSTI